MSKNVNALSVHVEKEEINDVASRVFSLSSEVIEMVDKVVNSVCKDLDEYVASIDLALVNDKVPVTNQQLEQFTLNLPTLLYFTTQAQEDIGIKEDVSRAVRNEVYNRVREKASGTVADKDAAAELQAQAETIVNIVYARAYKKIKLKVDAAYELLNSVKKVLTSRLAEYNITRVTGG